MTSQAHAAVWLDHQDARILFVDFEGVQTSTLRAQNEHNHRHPKGSAEEKEHPDDLKRFFAEIAKALAGAERVLVLGPSTAKHQLVHYAKEHDHALAGKIAAVENLDHPTDGQLADHVRRYFHVAAPRA